MTHGGVRSDSRLFCFLALLFVICVVQTKDPANAGEPRPVRSLLEMRHDKVVIQKWDLGCGAASLATLLNYQHGDPVTEREVARGLMRREEQLALPELILTRFGFSLLDQRFANDAKFIGHVIQGSDQVLATLVVGGSSIIAPGVLLDVATGIGLTDDGPD